MFLATSSPGEILTCGDNPFPRVGFMGLAGPPGPTKLSE